MNNSHQVQLTTHETIMRWIARTLTDVTYGSDSHKQISVTEMSAAVFCSIGYSHQAGKSYADAFAETSVSQLGD